MFDNARNRVIFALISGVVAYVVRKSFFERIVLIEHSKNGRFVSVSAKIWICGLYTSTHVVSLYCFLKISFNLPCTSDRV